MLREIPLPRRFEIWDVNLAGAKEELSTWTGVVFFDNRNRTIPRDVLGVLPIGPARSRLSCHVPISLQEPESPGSETVFCDQHLFVPRDDFVRRRGFVPEGLRDRLIREIWNQIQ